MIECVESLPRSLPLVSIGLNRGLNMSPPDPVEPRRHENPDTVTTATVGETNTVVEGMRGEPQTKTNIRDGQKGRDREGGHKDGSRFPHTHNRAWRVVQQQTAEPRAATLQPLRMIDFQACRMRRDEEANGNRNDRIGADGLQHAVRRLMQAGHTCVVHDRSQTAVDALTKEGAAPAEALPEFVKKLSQPRTICLMVPVAFVDSLIEQLAPLLERGDTIIDGGNTHYHDDIARARRLAPRGLHYIDMGTSGGVLGSGTRVTA